MIEETVKTSNISSDEETVLLNNPRIFPKIQKARIRNRDLKINSNYLKLSMPTLKDNDQNTDSDDRYIEYAIKRNQKEHEEIENLRKTRLTIQKVYHKQLTKKIEIKRQLRLAILTYFFKKS